MNTPMTGGQTAWLRAGAIVMCAAAAACSSLLDVNNPNNVSEDALGNPAAAQALTNGALAATVRMLSGTTVPYAVATDELDWIGSRDAWLELESGAISNHFNEFTDGAFPNVGEARYTADNAITRLVAFDLAGTLATRNSLAQAYMYGAVVYASIADMYDDFAFSNKTVPAKAVGRANMDALYDTAVVYLDRALVIANSSSAPAFVSLRYPITAYRARVKHAKAVWQSITPKLAPGVPRTVTYINDAGANADAAAALALDASDAAWTLVNNLEATAGINIWFEVNGRNEHRTGTVYRTLVDPVTAALDIRAQALLAQFTAFGTQSGTFTLTSNRELRLILAEAALAAGNTAEVTNQINLVRSLDAGRTAWDGSTPAQPVMLQHERQAQLWLMRRRLGDMYRFNTSDAKWVASPNFESAFNVNGLLFPIPNVERLGNPCIDTPTAAGC